MELKDIPNLTLVDGLTEEEVEFLTSRDEKAWQDIISSGIKAYSAEAEVIKEMYPEFIGKTLKQLNDDRDFQQALKNYRANYPHTVTEQGHSVEVLRSNVPQRHIKPNNKLANTITNDIIDEGQIELIVSNRRAKKEASTKVMLTYDNSQLELSGKEKYTPYDREVYDGVVTLYGAGNAIVTPAMVYRAMNGLTDSDKISSQAIDSVTKSLDKSRYIQVAIDYTEEAKLYNKDIEKTVYKGYLLAAEQIIVKISGVEQEAYKLLRKPILYEYAQVSGQVITVPAKLLQTKEAVRSTDEVIVIRGYLLRQIEWIKNEKAARSEKITYKGIYEELDITKDTYNNAMYKKKTHVTRCHVKAILDEWQEQQYIKNYEEYQEGKILKGVVIQI